MRTAEKIFEDLSNWNPPDRPYDLALSYVNAVEDHFRGLKLLFRELFQMPLGSASGFEIAAYYRFLALRALADVQAGPEAEAEVAELIEKILLQWFGDRHKSSEVLPALAARQTHYEIAVQGTECANLGELLLFLQSILMPFVVDNRDRTELGRLLGPGNDEQDALYAQQARQWGDPVLTLAVMTSVPLYEEVSLLYRHGPELSDHKLVKHIDKAKARTKAQMEQRLGGRRRGCFAPF